MKFVDKQSHSTSEISQPDRNAISRVSTTQPTDCLPHARRATAALRRLRLSPKERLKVCVDLLNNRVTDKRLHKFSNAIQALPIDDRHYWIGTFYTLLLSKGQRRTQSAYFTRPEIARHLIDQLEANGTDFRTARVLDPAAGGAAFLAMVAARMKELGCSNKSIFTRLSGFEIDPNLAKLSRLLIADRLGVATVPAKIIKVGDALKMRPRQKFDVVLANPPYGRVSPDQFRVRQWSSVCHPGHINLYALFIDFCLTQANAHGQLGFVIPSSFIAGPLYCRLRNSLRERSVVKLVGLIECRREFFLDVLQDVSLLVLERKSGDVDPTGSTQRDPIAFGRIDPGGRWIPSAPFGLPSNPHDGWVLPAPHETKRGGATLEDYGCRVGAGYFVWNRETERMRKKPLKRGRWVPLFWACNVRANTTCQPRAKDGKGIDYVRFDAPSQAIITGPSILLQRTTNTKQRRRLIAGLIMPTSDLTHGYVSENHTIIVRPSSADADLTLVCRLLNSAAVDRRYRQISGTASVSTLLLRALDLPDPADLRRALTKIKDFEAAVEVAYAGCRDAKRWRAP